jgi:hypothetical protein
MAKKTVAVVIVATYEVEDDLIAYKGKPPHEVDQKTYDSGGWTAVDLIDTVATMPYARFLPAPDGWTPAKELARPVFENDLEDEQYGDSWEQLFDGRTTDAACFYIARKFIRDSEA